MYELDKRPQGLLFYLSGKNGFAADYAAAQAEPTFCQGVEILPDQRLEDYFCCDDLSVCPY